MPHHRRIIVKAPARRPQPPQSNRTTAAATIANRARALEVQGYPSISTELLAYGIALGAVTFCFEQFGGS